MVGAAGDEVLRWLGAFADTAGAAVFVVDGDGRLRFVTGGLSQGLTEADLGRHLVELIPEEGEALSALQLVLSGQPVPARVRLQRGGLELEARFTALHDGNGTVTEVIGVAVDVTDRVKAERKVDLHRQFLSGVSHELRTPLNSILGFAQLLGSDQFGQLNERQRRYVDHIAGSSRLLLAIINDLLDLARIDAGRLNPDAEVVSLAEVADEAVSSLVPIFGSSGIVTSVAIDRALLALADRRRTLQILLNLLGNAAKFTPAGGSIRVSGRAKRRCVEVRVQDTGAGIPRQDLNRIFDEFAQVDAARAGERLGSGLGLPLSRRLARSMGGDLKVSSGQRGSTFTLSLPAFPAPPTRKPPARGRM
jgi:PAS domain S-box-containing protein